jgi:putative acyl-CoA dehydrogenase
LQVEMHSVRGQSQVYDAFVQRLPVLVDGMLEDEFLARPASEALARAIQGAELLRYSTPEVIDVFMATRLGGAVGNWGTMFGTMGGAMNKAQADTIVARAQVVR